MLDIKSLSASIEGKKILEGFDLKIKPGEVHAIMGPNGSGKSTLANVLTGKNGYEIGGQIFYEGKNLLNLPIEERAQKGLFMAFQYPLEIAGVNTNNFLKTSLNTIRKVRGLKELDSLELLNVGFSGGEKKKNEILQMTILEPKLAILDETDSGLDIDALRIVSDGVNALRSKERSFLIITHYQRLLDYIKPDFVHVLVDGKIAKTGCGELAEELEKVGYEKMGIDK
jgi:Fe-S cluster assembly ATP-binding protein